MNKLLMPTATAVWLIENTSLSFEQIAAFCAMHRLEIQSIADGETAQGIQAANPVSRGQLSLEEIARCEKDEAARLVMSSPDLPQPVLRAEKRRYAPLSRRAEKPDAIAWCLKHHPELPMTHLCRLVGTTRKTVESVKNRTHRNSANLQPRSPVDLGLCTREELRGALEHARQKPSQAESSL